MKIHLLKRAGYEIFDSVEKGGKKDFCIAELALSYMGLIRRQTFRQNGG